MTTMRPAVGIIRVSATNGREGESFASPEDQRARLENTAKRDGLQLIAVYDELDISGGKALDDRPGLIQAVRAIEDGRATVVIAAYFDRLFRSLKTQAEVLERVERAGGQVLAVDVGRVTNDSAGQWLSGTMLGAVSEYYRRSVAERVGDAHKRAVDRGVCPYPGAIPGYQRTDDGKLEPDDFAPVVAAAFRLRADGATVREVQAHLRDYGIVRTHAGTYRLLASRVVLGEIHFGKLVNLSAHPAIVDRDVWERVQRMKSPRGRHAKSDRLLARIGVLRCGTCGGRMIAGVVNRTAYPIYRCTPTSECARRVTISAVIAERVVSDAVRDALRDAQGRASIAESAQEARRRLATAQDALDATMRVFTLSGAENESAAIERLADLRQARDDAQAAVDQIGPEAALTVSACEDWDALSFDGRRELIRATVKSATVAPSGRGAERITVSLNGCE